MKVQVLQENLQRGLTTVARAVAARSTLPITANVLIETEDGRLKLAATDLDIGITSYVGARIDEEGATTVPARLIGDFVASLPSAPVDLQVAERSREVHLACARNESTINAMDAEDFPRIQSIAAGSAIQLDPRGLKHAIDRVEFAAASDDSRPALTGVHVKSDGARLTLAAADGFRLAVSDIDLEEAPAEPIEIIVPARAMRELSRLITDMQDPVEMRVNQQRTQVQFTMSETELVAQLIQGVFPNYGQLIPAEYNTRTTVQVDDFKRLSRIAAIFARDGSGIIRVEMNPAEGGEGGKLKVSARADEVGGNHGEVDAHVEGTAGKIAFNSRYLSDVLNALHGEVSLEVTNPYSQGAFRPTGESNYVHVVMPMYVDWGTGEA
ncbi:MAG: DNA polymerase III subunit beta [Dehalococcoidia bacterium]|nr:DNA polymerase III subunit beta [Dehalococcoidia bacterium]